MGTPPLLECGKFYKKGEVLEFKVFKFYDIYNKIIPLFKKYPIQGVKNKDFKDLCHVASMMKENKHLTKKTRGFFDQIRQIKAGMNLEREKIKKNKSSNQSGSASKKIIKASSNLYNQ